MKFKTDKMHWQTSGVVYHSRNCHVAVVKMNDDSISK
jgi:hypothetical protein